LAVNNAFEEPAMTNEKSIWSFDDADVTPEIEAARFYYSRIDLALMSGFGMNHSQINGTFSWKPKLQNTENATYFLKLAGLETLGL
jgi:hypothetical protein